MVYPPAAIKVLLDLVGPATTKYLLFSGELLTATEALSKGLVDRVLPAADLDTEVAAFATTLVSRSQLTIRSAKETVNALLSGEDPNPAALKRYQKRSPPANSTKAPKPSPRTPSGLPKGARLTRLYAGCAVVAVGARRAAAITDEYGWALESTAANSARRRTQKEGFMLILGLILLLLGFLLSVPVLWTIGIVLLIIGAVLFLLGSTGRAVGGRRHWF